MNTEQITAINNAMSMLASLQHTVACISNDVEYREYREYVNNHIKDLEDAGVSHYISDHFKDLCIEGYYFPSIYNINN